MSFCLSQMLCFQITITEASFCLFSESTCSYTVKPWDWSISSSIIKVYHSSDRYRCCANKHPGLQLICYSFVSLKVCKERMQKSTHADSRNTKKLLRFTYTALRRLGERQGKRKTIKNPQTHENSSLNVLFQRLAQKIYRKEISRGRSLC